MPHDYLHKHLEFKELIRIVSDERGIPPDLVEKDYWIMHCLYGLQKQEYSFQLKGGTSLSKGYGIINRFSEDIDVWIDPPDKLEVMTGKNHTKRQHCEGRRKFYDGLAKEICIDGITEVTRDTTFDNERYFSGGIRLHYAPSCPIAMGVKDGILLEVGFDTTTPNHPVDISSWALDYALEKDVDVIENRAKQVSCYHPGYTFVEKLQTIATKFRRQRETGEFQPNFMRHYYDVACLLDHELVQGFIGTQEYMDHKDERFPRTDKEVSIIENEAFLLSDPEIREIYKNEYVKTESLYYNGQVPFDEIMQKITGNLGKL